MFIHRTLRPENFYGFPVGKGWGIRRGWGGGGGVGLGLVQTSKSLAGEVWISGTLSFMDAMAVKMSL